MNRRTRFTIGVALVVSAITTVISFLVLCFKKKNIWAAILAVAAAETTLGFALIDNKIPAKITFRKKSAEEGESDLADAVESLDEDSVPAEDAGDEAIEDGEETVPA